MVQCDWELGTPFEKVPSGEWIRVTSLSSRRGLIAKVLTQDKFVVSKQPPTLQLHLALNLVDITSRESHPILVYDGVATQTLLSLIQNTLLPFERALALAIQLCDAVRELHRQGVVHGRIRPDSCLILPGEQLKISEHNLPWLWNEIQPYERAFMDPHATTPGTRNEQSDLYAIGVTLYQIATGHLPFDEIPSEGTPRAEKLPPAIGKRSSNWPISGFDLMNRCVSLDPRRRFETITALRNGLARLSTSPIAMLDEFSSDRMRRPNLSSSNIPRPSIEQRHPPFTASAPALDSTQLGYTALFLKLWPVMLVLVALVAAVLLGVIPLSRLTAW